MYILRPMKVTDVDQVVRIDHRSFSMPWSPLTYNYEIKHNANAALGVIELPGQPAPPANSGFLSRLQIIRKTPPPAHTLVAYGGMWVRRREAHISTIASHPDYRGYSLGELMLLGMIVRGIVLEADHVVLEVRASNTVAQNLYRKYGFTKTRILSNYYRDNHEDAYYMVAKPLDARYRSFLRASLIALYNKVPFQDQFTGIQMERAVHSPVDQKE